MAINFASKLKSAQAGKTVSSDAAASSTALREAVAKALDLCHTIERLPASEWQTDLSVAASAVYRRLAVLEAR